MSEGACDAQIVMREIFVKVSIFKLAGCCSHSNFGFSIVEFIEKCEFLHTIQWTGGDESCFDQVANMWVLDSREPCS